MKSTVDMLFKSQKSIFYKSVSRDTPRTICGTNYCPRKANDLIRVQQFDPNHWSVAEIPLVIPTSTIERSGLIA